MSDTLDFMRATWWALPIAIACVLPLVLGIALNIEWLTNAGYLVLVLPLVIGVVMRLRRRSPIRTHQVARAVAASGDVHNAFLLSQPSATPFYGSAEVVAEEHSDDCDDPLSTGTMHITKS